jgi:poly(hydroxyalkanoate) depolymerase family esterase
VGNWWQRLKARVLGWFRREPAPGRFEGGSKFSPHGWVSTAPAVWPRRDYLVYVPKGAPRFSRVPLLVLIHGCRQTADDIARGTRIAEFADREGTVVLLPHQKDSANPWRCWNWFDPRTSRGGGEAAIVAAQIRAVRRHYRIDRKRVYVSGMSSGGALAAVIGVRFPHLVSAVAVHSGIACGAARSAMSAIGVLQRGPEQDVEAIAADAREAAAPSDIRVPLLAIQGDRDEVVPPVHATALVRQYLVLNGDDPARPPDAEARIAHPDGRVEIVRDWRRDGSLVVRHVEVEGLGHAWSGGDASLQFNDAGPPDATALLGAFFADALSSRPEGAKRRWRFWA